jgi:ATP-binding cassette, subfamily B, bacterial
MDLPFRRSVSFIPQMDIAECGAACLAMVTSFHGYALRLAEARAACGVSRDGVSALAIVKAAQGMDFEAHGVRVELDELEQLKLPAILHWGLNHFVVLERVTKAGLVVVDPACGRRHVSALEADERFTGVALVVTRTARTPRRKLRALRILSYAGGVRQYTSTTLAMLWSTLLFELLGILFPAATQVLIDQVVVPGRETWLVPIVMILALTLMVGTAFQLLRVRALQTLHLALDLNLFSRFVSQLSRLPLAFFRQRAPGDLLERVEANQALRQACATMLTALLDGTLVLSYGALMLAYDLQLGLLVVVFQTIRIASLVLLRSYATTTAATELSFRSDERVVATEAFSSPETVLAFGVQDLFLRKFTTQRARHLNAVRVSARLKVAVVESAKMLDGLGYALILWYGGQAVMTERLSLGVFAGFLTLVTFLNKPLECLVSAYSELQVAKSILMRIDDVLGVEALRDGTASLRGFRGALELRDLSFRYGANGLDVLKNVNLRIEAGEKVAIVGRSGEGKSTLVKVLLGLEQPSEGVVLLDGQRLGNLRRSEVLSHFGAVIQDPLILSGSVRENVAFGRACSDEAVWRALSIACLDDVVARLPNKLDAFVGEGGGRLSGGQRQRLVTARAVMGSPKVLVLDEATSALDPSTEAAVHARLGSLGCTRVVVAHRLATVQDADRVLVLERGRIVQTGTFQELSRTEGPFARLVSSLE